MTQITLNILLADDDTDDCIFFKEALDELSIDTKLIAVNDGEQLMQLLNNEGIELPDVLFLDINMPRKNGKECLKEIKQNEKLRHFPIIMFSTSYEQEVVSLLYNNGAHNFIRKPSEFLQFKKVIQQTLKSITNTLLSSKSNTISQPLRENFVLIVHNNELSE